MSTAESDDFIANKADKNGQSESSEFSAPLGVVKSGHLIFASGAQGLELTANPSMSYLYKTRFRGYIPRVLYQENIVTVEYSHFPFPEPPINLRRPLAEISLNGSIPWEIEFRNGVSHLNADLAQFQLRSLDILGGANQIRLVLSKPSGTTFFYISGGIRQSAIRVPSTAEIRVRISGGSTNLTFEEKRFRAIGGEMSLESSNFKSSTSQYDICIAGGSSNLTIDRKG